MNKDSVNLECKYFVSALDEELNVYSSKEIRSESAILNKSRPYNFMSFQQFSELLLLEEPAKVAMELKDFHDTNKHRGGYILFTRDKPESVLKSNKSAFEKMIDFHQFLNESF